MVQSHFRFPRVLLDLASQPCPALTPHFVRSEQKHVERQSSACVVIVESVTYRCAQTSHLKSVCQQADRCSGIRQLETAIRGLRKREGGPVGRVYRRSEMERERVLACCEGDSRGRPF